MRLLFLLLVLANLGFFAWSRYLAPADAALDSAPLSRQIEPEKLRIVRPGEAAKAALKPPPPVAVAPAAPAPAPAPAPVASCLEWGSFTLVDAPKAEKVLEPLILNGRI